MTELTAPKQTPPAGNASPDEPTVAIAFGGGGARGFAHVHAIETLDEMGIRPVAISGASIGSIMGTAMAAGMRGTDVRDFILTLVSNRAELLSRFWAARPAGFTDMVDGGFRVGQFNIERIIRAFMPDAIPQTFEDLAIPMSIIGTDYYGHRQTCFETGDLISAIAASSAIPALFRPIKRDGRIFIDGGLFNPVPYDHLFAKADIVVGIDVVGAPIGNPDVVPKAIDSIYGASQLVMQSVIQLKLQVKAPDVFVRPPVSQFRVMDFLKGREIIEESISVREDLRHKLEAAIAAWHAHKGS